MKNDIDAVMSILNMDIYRKSVIEYFHNTMHRNVLMLPDVRNITFKKLDEANIKQLVIVHPCTEIDDHLFDVILNNGFSVEDVYVIVDIDSETEHVRHHTSRERYVIILTLGGLSVLKQIQKNIDNDTFILLEAGNKTIIQSEYEVFHRLKRICEDF